MIPKKHIKMDMLDQTDTVRDIDTNYVRSELKECSLYDDTWLTNEEFKSRVSEHLEKIRDIDMEYFKSGHELFSCNIFNFE